MTETDMIGRDPRGFAGLIANIMSPLNDNPKFKELFKDSKRKYLVNALNLKYAALITIDKGTISFKGIPNTPKSNLKKKFTGRDSLVSMSSETFMLFAMDRISLFKVVFLWVIRKVKLKGLTKIFGLMKLFNILSE